MPHPNTAAMRRNGKLHAQRGVGVRPLHSLQSVAHPLLYPWMTGLIQQHLLPMPQAMRRHPLDPGDGPEARQCPPATDLRLRSPAVHHGAPRVGVEVTTDQQAAPFGAVKMNSPGCDSTRP